MKYSIQEAFEAKEHLMKLGFSEDQFKIADSYWEEVGFMVGEPILFGTDSDPISAHKMYQDFLYRSDKQMEDYEMDFFSENN